MAEHFIVSQFLTGDLVDPCTRASRKRVRRPVIEKPFQPGELVRVLREQFGRRPPAQGSSHTRGFPELSTYCGGRSKR